MMYYHPKRAVASITMLLLSWYNIYHTIIYSMIVDITCKL